MSAEVKHRRDSKAVVDAVTPAVAELGFITDKKKMRYGDGVKLGGFNIQREHFSEVLSPPQITAQQNNYSPTGLEEAGILVLDLSANFDITGLLIPGAAGNETGRRIGITTKIGSTGVPTLKMESGSSTITNRFQNDTGDQIVITEKTVVWFEYIASRWLLQSTTVRPSASVGGIDSLMFHGADIVAAASINLETATGSLVDVTGSTDISTIILSEGHERTVRFTGTPKIVNGSSLVNIGGKDIKVVAGDFAQFRGYASNVVRMVDYVRTANPPVQEVHGADIASAATVDLESATGDLVDVTGTVTITAITLSEGHQRTVRFTGALTLTHGASLVLPGAVNRTTVAGDIAVFRGYAAGVVRCVLYSPITVTGTGAGVLANSPSFTGSPTGPTAALGDNTAFLATTAFVAAASLGKNLVINGSMRFDQRNAGASMALTGSTVYYLDRWWAITANTGHIQRVTDAPVGFSNSLKVSRDNGVTSTSPLQFGQVIPSPDCVGCQSQIVTLSYWAKAGANFSPTSSLISISLFTGTVADQGSASLNAGTWTGFADQLNASQAITTSWVRYSHTMAAFPSGTLEIGIRFGFTPVGTAGANDWVEITGVQIEVGPVATTFERRLYDDELERCRRRYQTSGRDLVGRAIDGTHISVFGRLAPPMAVAPTSAYLSGGFACPSVTGISTVSLTGATNTTTSTNLAVTTDNIFTASQFVAGFGDAIVAHSAEL